MNPLMEFRRKFKPFSFRVSTPTISLTDSHLHHNNLTAKGIKQRRLAAAKYARRESNPNRRNRNPIFYPLNYGHIFLLWCCKSTKVFVVLQIKHWRLLIYFSANGS